jgi:hypothetical protein
MKRHIAYLKYVLRHKWYVFLAGQELGVDLVQLIVHDWHKFLPSEWFPYARTFYKSNGEKQYVESEEFSQAWRKHQQRGKHHWQHWLITWDRGETEALPMPWDYVEEMVADWYGAGKAITGKWEAKQWFEANKHKMKLHPVTVERIEQCFYRIDVFTDHLNREGQWHLFQQPPSVK